MKSRRHFLGSALLLCVSPLTLNAQNQPRVGLLSIGTDPVQPNPVWVAFLDHMRQTGYVEGRNIEIERRFAGGKEELLATFAAELARLRLDVVVATGDVECMALKRAMPQTPIVMMLVQDPVGAGLVASLAWPGGNVTGLTTQAPELYAKRLELLKTIVPSLQRVAVLLNLSSPGAKAASDEMAAAARLLGLQLHSFPVHKPEELDGAFGTLGQQRTQAMVVVTDGLTFNQRAHIAGQAAKIRLPTIFEVRYFVDVGGLLSYGPSYIDLARQAGGYVDRILKGAKPADLPVQQPTKFELIVNLKTANALGLKIPQSVLIRADQIIV